MKINSVWHLTFSGRSIRIDSHGTHVLKRDAVVFTRVVELSGYVREDTRIIPENIAKVMKLRKYIALSEKTVVSAGAFEVRIEDADTDRLRYNISINDSIYYLSFIPGFVKPMHRDSVLLIPADTRYYNIEDLEKIKNFIDLSKAKKIFATGDMSMDLAAMFKSGKITIVNEAVQQDIFK
jgi:hypothetical protein